MLYNENKVLAGSVYLFYIFCSPIDSMTGSIDTGRKTPTVIDIDHQEAIWKTENFVQVDDMS